MSALSLVVQLHEKGLTFTQIVKITGLSRPEVMDILQDAGISKKSIHLPTALTPWAEAVLIGTMLGAGNITIKRSGENPYFQLSHSFQQNDYLCWKAEQLDELFLATPPCHNTEGDGHQSVHLTSRAMPLLCEYEALFYAAKHRQVTDALLARVAAHEFVDAILAVWFGDDGYRSSGNGKSLGFCFGALNEPTYQRLADWFRARGFDGTLHQHMGRESYRYFLMKIEAAHRFREVISPYLPACMHYKLDIGPLRKIRRSRIISPAAVVSDRTAV